MDPLTFRITQILVDKGTFYTLISLNLVMLTWELFCMILIIISYYQLCIPVCELC